MTAPRGTSLAARLVVLYAIGSAVIMAAAGYALYHALRMQLESQNAAEIDGKTEVVEHILAEVTNAQALHENLPRLREVSIGHPHLALAVRFRNEWLIPPIPQLLEGQRSRHTEHRRDLPMEQVQAGGRTWLVRTVRSDWPPPSPDQVDVLIAVEVTESLALLRDHAAIASLVAVLGALASALLAWIVTRRGLRPLSQLATRAEEVTAQRLGSRLALGGAPREVQSLADSINRMLERLEESFRTLEQFSADIAHELRTPVNNLLLQTQVTLNRPRTLDEYQDTLHHNLQELEGLQRMISEMLFLARAERGMLEVGSEKLDLAAEAGAVAEYFEAVAAERGLAIQVSGTAGLQGDRMLLKRALTNLLSNAIRYSPDAATISIHVSSTASGARIEVSNPSEPIEPAELHRLFKRFARRDGSRTRAREGAGLGLAIVESIMKLQGGNVEAHWRDGTIVFTLAFPAAGATLAPGERSQ